MHVEVPKASSFNEFRSEYLMIVISILTALALEHGAQTLHRHHIASQAAANMDTELRANLDDLNQVLAHNKAEVKKLADISDALLADIRRGVPDAEIMDHIYHDKNKHFGLSVQQPSFHREAWDVAVANQAVSWMEQQDLRRYSRAYGDMRDVQLLANGGAMTFINGPGLRDVGSNIEMGNSNPREIYRMLGQMISSYNSLDGNLENLQKELQESIKPRAEK